MKFSVGYSTGAKQNFIDGIIERKDSISEIYCSWADFPSGRNDQTAISGLTSWEAKEKQVADLKKFAQNGLKLNLLFNANCYGKNAQSKSFFNSIGEVVDYAIENLNLTSITTTSLFVAKFIKQNFDGIDVRASVNMGIGEINGFEYVKEYFDSFYAKRELNRDFEALNKIKSWCEANGKKIYLLANGGCLNHCSAHTFHDNLVAHEKEISQMDNGYKFESVCGKYISNKDNWHVLLDGSSYIRPEDVHLYEGLVDSMKLATRVHENPIRVIRAYIDNKKYSGNVLELLEPNHSGKIYPYVLDNGQIMAEVIDNKLKYTGEKAFVKLEECYVDKQND